ncbi:hypothetical protein B0H16DRAFT_1735697 [Mycena metata]|uniref:Uncharacterized protein n=1 Tax=Mycena metata TaxID=1033252 RepID=A0AAD7HR35_9AGAR|nr:hypothetical protein B0H16DRAFT_1735697 [Mycena metata]
MPPYARRSEAIPVSTWALVSIIIPGVLLGVSFFLALRCGVCKKITRRRRRAKEGGLISTSDDGSSIVESKDEDHIVDVHEITNEGLTLSVAVIPAAVMNFVPLEDEKHPGESESSPADGTDAPSRISRSATIRRQYLESELRRTQEQMVDIDSLTMRGSPRSSRMSLATILGSPAGESNQELADLLKAARDRNASLAARIEALESQMQSAWAQGLSDEPPPGYTLE